MSLSQHLVLIGPMGAGKSTVGRCISDNLKSPFVDLDKYIEDRAGASIPWIFDIEGEGGFRERETQALTDVLKLPACVIATGGGCVLREENRVALQANAFVVYLVTSIEQQLERTAKDKNRPLIQTEDPASVLSTLAVERAPLYQSSSTIDVHTDGKSPKMIVDEILNFIKAENNENLNR